MSDLLHSTGYSFNQLQVQVRRSNQAEDHDMHVRIAKIESDISYIKRDISELKTDIKDIRNDVKDINKRMHSQIIWLLTTIGSTSAAIVGIMAKGFGWL